MGPTRVYELPLLEEMLFLVNVGTFFSKVTVDDISFKSITFTLMFQIQCFVILPDLSSNMIPSITKTLSPGCKYYRAIGFLLKSI